MLRGGVEEIYLTPVDGRAFSVGAEQRARAAGARHEEYREDRGEGSETLRRLQTSRQAFQRLLIYRLNPKTLFCLGSFLNSQSVRMRKQFCNAAQ